MANDSFVKQRGGASFFSTKDDRSISGILSGSPKRRDKKVNTTQKNKRVIKKLGAGAGVTAIVLGIVLVFVYIFAIKPAYSLLTNVNALKADLALIKDSAAKRDLVALEDNFNQTERDLNDFRTARDNNVGWMASFGPTKNYYQDSEHFINTGLHLIDAGRETIKLMVPFADAGGFKISAEQEVVETGLAEAFAQWVAIMPEIAGDLDPVLGKLDLAGQELAQVDASRYPEYVRGQPIRESIVGAQSVLTQVNEAGPDLKKALTIIPGLLGVGGPERRYMIMFQNDKEIRATGGFWTYFATFRLNNALLSSDFTSYGTYDIDFALDAIDSYYTFPTVPAAYQNHLKVERLFARDANISPDLPTSLDQFDLFWSLAQPLAPAQFKPIDGVFTIDTVVLEELLQVTGPVTLNGVTYSPDTVTIELEKLASIELSEQANRKKILGDLMQEMLINVFESERNLWPKLVDKGIDLARRKHVQAWVFDAEAQPLLEKYNFAGRVVDPVVGDYAYWVSANLGGGKTYGWFVNKDVEHKLEKEGDRWVRTETATFTYSTENPGNNPDYDLFKQRYQDWVRLYVPLGSELISVDGSDDPTTTSEERNKTVFDGYVTLAPGESKTISFRYYLPQDMTIEDVYNLYIQKQSGVNTETHTVVVNGEAATQEIDMDLKYNTRL